MSALTGRAPKLRVLTIASELSPWAKTGGLADVVSSLPAALERLGHQVTIVVPRYRGMTVAADESIPWRIDLGARSHQVTFRRLAISERRDVVLVDEPALFDRPQLYGEGNADYPDNARRFALLSAAALEFAEHVSDAAPDVVHGHDWQAGIALAMLAQQRW